MLRNDGIKSNCFWKVDNTLFRLTDWKNSIVSNRLMKDILKCQTKLNLFPIMMNMVVSINTKKFHVKMNRLPEKIIPNNGPSMESYIEKMVLHGFGLMVGKNGVRMVNGIEKEDSPR